MPYIDNDGVKIYYKTVGTGSPLVFAHGMSMSIEDWEEWGYVSALCERHQLILVDGRGHGKSDKPRE